MAPNRDEWVWSRPKERAAGLVAEDRLTDIEIAAEVGVSKRTLERWKSRVEFFQRVDEHIAAFRAQAERFGIAQVGRRVAALQRRHRSLERIIAERAEEMGDEAPGGETGLLIRRVKGIGSGPNFQVVTEYELDADLLRELREHEEQAARHLAQLTQRVEVLQRAARQVQAMSDDELLRLLFGGADDPATPGGSGDEASGAESTDPSDAEDSPGAAGDVGPGFD